MIELTEEQIHALEQANGAPPRMVNPRTNETFALVPTEDRIQIVSENYRWHESTNEIEDWRTGSRYPYSLYESKVSVYEDRVRTWFLDLAKKETAAGTSPGDYLAVLIALAYIEGVEQYREGKKPNPGQAGLFFKASAKRIFPNAPEEAIDRLWGDVRNGLFHSGFTEKPTVLSHRGEHALWLDGRYLTIHPALFVEAVVGDFKNYIRELRTNSKGETAKRFETHWDSLWAST